MHIIHETEKDTQKRVIELFQDVLNYTYLGNWTDSVDENSNIIPEDLADWLRRQNHDSNIINKAVLWDVNTGNEQQTLLGHSYWLTSVSFSTYNEYQHPPIPMCHYNLSAK